ncbi:hypothetical protein LCI18_013798 [Fusarium solani-melongenae]|uniref:Uncharacterized protein n=1 Tax=Fusarium solani subsp. cucurbitae TaxID=2747967 RepID=A0ACD3ZNF5_FUSSC|nr:hypothetical protein LCI18_013798 [Fusarium solani-melongenae]
MTQNIVYNETQLQCYFDRVGLPNSDRHLTVVGLSAERQLEILTVLQKHQLVQVPFENLTLHYSWHRVINLDPEHLFNKIVCDARRGGYCMENNTFFHVVLRSLGYTVYMVGARPHDRASSRYGGLTHCLNIVIIDGMRYAIDVCFGSRVPILPLKLQDGDIQRHSEPGQMRVRYDSIPQALCQDQKLWIYEHRKDAQAAWIPQYCFAEFELLYDDINCINWAPAKSGSSFFTQRVVAVKFTAENEVYHSDNTAESNNDKAEVGTETNIGYIDGALIVDGHLFKWRKRGVVVWEQELTCEAERVHVLHKYFGISLAVQDIKSIEGSVAEITNLAKLQLQ